MSAFKVSAQAPLEPPIKKDLSIYLESVRMAKEREIAERKELLDKINTADEYLSKAIDYMSNGDYRAADMYIDMSIRTYECPQNRYIKGSLSLEYSGNPDEAIKSLEYCLKNDYRPRDTNILLAECYMAKRDYYSALSYFNAGKANESRNPQVLELMGICNERLNNSDAALQNYLRAASFEGTVQYDFSNIYNNIAYEYMRRGNLALAKSYIENAVRSNASYGNAWDTYGEISYRMGNYTDAISCMDKSIQLAQGRLTKSYWLDNSYYYRGLANYKLNRKQDAYDDLKKASNLGNADATNSLNTLNFQQSTKKTTATKKRVQSKSKR